MNEDEPVFCADILCDGELPGYGLYARTTALNLRVFNWCREWSDRNGGKEWSLFGPASGQWDRGYDLIQIWDPDMAIQLRLVFRVVWDRSNGRYRIVSEL